MFDRWLGEGKHAGMDYLVRHREIRRDPSALLEGARSAICVGLNYYRHEEKEQRRLDVSDGRGVFSIYSHAGDYHDVMERMLRRLADGLNALVPDVRTVTCVDTSPVSDRALALRAGIGWLGKNSSVVSPRYGSWIFLGELLTTLDLEPDRPLETLCGECTRCIDACPTGALNEPFVVDARVCVSYLTIEKRGNIRADLHGNIGNRVFGCDTCQSVCPYNDVATDTLAFEREKGAPIVGMEVKDLEKITNAEFDVLTRGSAIRRCKPEGMRRNAAIVRRNIEVRAPRPERLEGRPKR